VYWQPNAAINPVATLGDTFEGFFITNAGPTTATIEPHVAVYTSPAQMVQVRFGSGYTVTGQSHVLVTDDVYGSSFDVLAGASGLPPTMLNGHPVSGFTPSMLGLWFVSSGTQMNPALSLDVHNLLDYNLRNLQIDFGRPTGPGGMLFYPIYGSIDAVTRGKVVTPEPGSAVLLGTGLAAAGWLKRRKKTGRV